MKSEMIHYDHIKLLIKGCTNLMLMLLVFIGMGFVDLNPIGVLLAITLCWFTGKAGGRALYRLCKRKPLCVLSNHEMIIAMPSGDGKVMKVKDIKSMDVKETTNRIQLVIHGDHIEHPSGAYLIDIHYPYQKQKLQNVSNVIQKWIKKQNITVNVIEQNKKEVVVNA